jgi:hypothetical protein
MIDKNNIVSVEKKYELDNSHQIYKVIFETDKICFVPVDEANTDYQTIQEWIAEGNTVIDNPPQENN